MEGSRAPGSQITETCKRTKKKHTADRGRGGLTNVPVETQITPKKDPSGDIAHHPGRQCVRWTPLPVVPMRCCGPQAQKNWDGGCLGCCTRPAGVPVCSLGGHRPMRTPTVGDTNCLCDTLLTAPPTQSLFSLFSLCAIRARTHGRAPVCLSHMQATRGSSHTLSTLDPKRRRGLTQ
jgi:hypothetical protein